jgi:TrmH family RNA methyltransferase
VSDILSTRNPRVQQLRRLLGRRSARRDTGRFVIEGPRLVADAVRAGVIVDEVFVEVGGVVPSVPSDVPVHEVDHGVLARVGSTVAPQPCLAVARSSLVPPDDLPSSGVVVVLVGANDPGNAGAVIRSAEAAGAAAVVLLGDAVDPLNPKVVRASAGSLFRLAVAAEPDVGGGLDRLRSSGRRLIGTSARDGEPYDGGGLRGDVALVLGSETHGLDAEVAERLDGVVTIPMAGEVESLNLAMAATLLLYEATREPR